MQSSSPPIFRFLHNKKKLNLWNGYSVRTLTEPVTGASGECKTERIKSNSAMKTGKFQR